MSNFAFLVPAYAGHLNPARVLGRELRSRGHRIALLSTTEAEPVAREEGFQFFPIAGPEFPDGGFDAWNRRLGKLTGLKATRHATTSLARFTRGILRDLPPLADREKFDGLVMDQLSFGAESVCHVKGLPLAVISNSLMGHSEPAVPPLVFPWRFRPGLPFTIRNLLGQALLMSIGLRLVTELTRYRRRHRLPWLKSNHGNEMPPSLVQLAQIPAFFDFPRKRLPDHFFYTAPWIDEGPVPKEGFPWERRNGQKLIYASFGTLQNLLENAFEVVARACAGFDAQLVIAMGRKGAAVPASLPGNPIVVDFAPQRALIAEASLVVFHGGLNTALECLSAGVPSVAIPITNDQPGVAVRLERLGAGKFIPVKKLNVRNLRSVIEIVLTQPRYREEASRCARDLALLDGPAEAARLIELAFRTRQRVTHQLEPRSATSAGTTCAPFG